MKYVTILKDVKITRKMVWVTKRHCAETGGVQDQPRSGRPNSARTHKLRPKVRTNPKRSIMKLATELKVSEGTMQRAVHRDLKLNQVDYLNLLKKDVLPWCQGQYGKGSYTFTQDKAPSHTARCVQKWCRDNFPSFWSKEMWSPSSPDCNPMDFSLWSILQSKVCNVYHVYVSVDHLNAHLIKEREKIDEDTMRTTCRAAHSRLKAVVASNGDHVE